MENPKILQHRTLACSKGNFSVMLVQNDEIWVTSDLCSGQFEISVFDRMHGMFTYSEYSPNPTEGALRFIELCTQLETGQIDLTPAGCAKARNANVTPFPQAS